MKKYVLDASTITNFLLKQDNHTVKKIAQLLKQAQEKKLYLASHSLFLLEVSNAIRFKIASKKAANEALLSLLKLPINFEVLSPTSYLKILQISFDTNDTVYDVSYHFLAIATGAVLLTSDKKYFQKAKYLGSIELL